MRTLITSSVAEYGTPYNSLYPYALSRLNITILKSPLVGKNVILSNLRSYYTHWFSGQHF